MTDLYLQVFFGVIRKAILLGQVTSDMTGLSVATPETLPLSSWP